MLLAYALFVESSGLRIECGSNELKTRTQDDPIRGRSYFTQET